MVNSTATLPVQRDETPALRALQGNQKEVRLSVHQLADCKTESLCRFVEDI